MPIYFRFKQRNLGAYHARKSRKHLHPHTPYSRIKPQSIHYHNDGHPDDRPHRTPTVHRQRNSAHGMRCNLHPELPQLRISQKRAQKSHPGQPSRLTRQPASHFFSKRFSTLPPLPLSLLDTKVVRTDHFCIKQNIKIPTKPHLSATAHPPKSAPAPYSPCNQSAALLSLQTQASQTSHNTHSAPQKTHTALSYQTTSSQ